MAELQVPETKLTNVGGLRDRVAALGRPGRLAKTALDGVELGSHAGAATSIGVCLPLASQSSDSVWSIVTITHRPLRQK
jgi:hypothetical protein